MKDFFKYAYYRVYEWQLGAYGKHWLPAETAILNVGLMVMAPYFIFVALVIKYEPFGISFEPTKYTIITIILMVIEDFFIRRWLKGKHYKILKQFKNESQKQSNKGLLLIWGYISFFVAVPIIIIATPGGVKDSKEKASQKIEKSIFKHERTMKDLEGYEKNTIKVDSLK